MLQCKKVHWRCYIFALFYILEFDIINGNDLAYSSVENTVEVFNDTLSTVLFPLTLTNFLESLY